MKKLFFFATMLIAALGFSSCSSDSAGEEAGDVELAAAQYGIKSKLAGMMLLDEKPVIGPSITKETFNWKNDVAILEEFPEHVTPEGVYHNFVYYSTGEPFDLVMLYSNGGYRHVLGIYWYDEDGEKHEKTVWDERTDETFRTWFNNNGNPTDIISRLNENAGAYKIQLPKGTKFGFYQESYKATSEGWELVTEPVRMNPPAGDIEAMPYKFYTEYAYNWNYPLTKDMVPTGQAMTTEINGWTIVGFEDISLTYPSCDKDYNDVVFAINPVQKTKPDPDPEIVDGSVETNLSVTEENGQDKVKLSIHVRAVTDVEVIIPVVDSVLADDFAILAKHDVEQVYAEPMTIAGQTVTLTYSLTEEGYLKITTNGINEEVINYCKNTYADGLTFECNLFYGKFDLKAEPTIKFTKNPTFYITSCVTNSPEAEDFEVVWDDKTIKSIDELDFQTTGGKFIYNHDVYSPYTVEQLKNMGWIKTAEETEETE